ncbi:hypothetical protein KAR91_34990 [Candidatus Pacearchaeota archaeon]|nr:hypothetical protein [Candidatus Pacearchaeota archaeon]
MTNLTQMSDRDIMIAARQAMERHDDRTAIRLLFDVLKTPNQLICSQALTQIEMMLLRLRGYSGLRAFFEKAEKEGLLPKLNTILHEAVSESEALIIDHVRGRALLSRTLSSLETLQKQLLRNLQESLPHFYNIRILLAYLRILRFAVCTCPKEKLFNFCNKHALHLWPDNQGMSCLVPVSYIQSVLDDEQVEIKSELLQATAYGIWASLLFYPEDPDARAFVTYFLDRIETAWTNRLRDSISYLASTRQALSLFMSLQVFNNSKLHSSLCQVINMLDQYQEISTDDLGVIEKYSEMSGSLTFLHEFNRGRRLFELGDFSLSGRIFDKLLQQNITQPLRKKILQSRLATDLGRLCACDLFDLPTKEFASETECRLKQLRELDGNDWSSISAKFHLDYFVLSNKSACDLPEDLVTARTFIMRKVMECKDPVVLAKSDLFPTLIQSGFLSGLSVDQTVEELASISTFDAFADIVQIIQGQPLAPVVPSELPENEKAADEEVDEENVVKISSDELKWLKEIFEEPSVEKLREIFRDETCWIIEYMEHSSSSSEELIRLCISRITFQIIKKLVSENNMEIASRLFNYVIDRVPEKCLPEEKEIMLHMEVAILLGNLKDKNSLKQNEALLDRIIDFAGDRSAGELSIGTRKLLVSVYRNLNVLRKKPSIAKDEL